MHCPCNASGPPSGSTYLHALNEIAIYALNIPIDRPGSSCSVGSLSSRGSCHLGSLIPDGSGCGNSPSRATLPPTTHRNNERTSAVTWPRIRQPTPLKGRTGLWPVWEDKLGRGRLRQDELCNMGGSTKLRFPLPHRRQKQQLEVQSISAPMTNKAQKLLGTAEINIDASSPTSSTGASKVWETNSAISTSASGISVTISESTATGTTTRKTESTVTGGIRGRGRTTWDQESDIIPKGLGISGSAAGRSQMLDAMTDDSSLRRRRSSSTIASYYDKSKLPLSISQQTSNSAMAKGLPNKAAELLDMECPRPAPSPPNQSRRKPSRLDFSHLLPRSASSRLSRFAQKSGMVLGADLLTRSPSVMSSPPTLSPAEVDVKPERKLQRKLTKESLRSLQSSRQDQRHSSCGPDSRSASLRTRATDSGNLHHLYEHYEKTSYRDTMTQEMAAAMAGSNGDEEDLEESESKTGSQLDYRHSATTASPASANKNRHRFPSYSSTNRRQIVAYTPDEDCGPIAENPRASVASSSLMSPPTDYAASVSSRHTRTSKATQKTEQSFADFDPNATSVLSLSSDSEEDDLETSLPSVHSRDSVSGPTDCRRPTTSKSQDSNRSQLKSRFRTSLTSQAPFLAIPEHTNSVVPAPPPINPRTSSLTSAITGGSGHRPSVSTTSSSVRSPSRQSQISTSTTESASAHFSRPRPSLSSSVTSSSPRQPTEVRHVAMLQSRTAITPQKQIGLTAERAGRKAQAHISAAQSSSQPTPPLSPSSMELGIRGHSDLSKDNGGPVVTLNGTGDAGDERFMAVTRQEEMLLAAMRAKRALMRENLHIADIADLDRGSESRERTASKKESLSSIKTIKANTLRPPQAQSRSSHKRGGSKTSTTVLGFPEPPSTKLSAKQINRNGEHEEVLTCLDHTIGTKDALDMTEPSPDLSDFIIDFDADQFPSPPKPTDTAHVTEISHNRTPSSGSVVGQLTQRRTTRHRQKPSLDRPRPDSEFMPNLRPASEQAPPLPSYEGVDLDAVSHTDIMGLQTAKGRADKTQAVNGLLTDSATALHAEEPVSKSSPPSRKKEVRISAVGLHLPEVGQWGDDG